MAKKRRSHRGKVKPLQHTQGLNRVSVSNPLVSERYIASAHQKKDYTPLVYSVLSVISYLIALMVYRTASITEEQASKIPQVVVWILLVAFPVAGVVTWWVNKESSKLNDNWDWHKARRLYGFQLVASSTLLVAILTPLAYAYGYVDLIIRLLVEKIPLLNQQIAQRIASVIAYLITGVGSTLYNLLVGVLASYIANHIPLIKRRKP